MTAAPVRILILGTWHVHTKGFVDKAERLSAGRFEWAGVWDSDSRRGREMAEQLQVPYYTTVLEALKQSEADAVMIEAETSQHRNLIESAAGAGLHIFTDKVIALNGEDAEACRKAAENAGVNLAVSHESVTLPVYRYALQQYRSGNLGELVSIHFRRSHGLAWTDVLPPSWYDPSISGGGALIDLGIHGVSMLQLFGGRITSVQAQGSYRTGKEVEDSATILVDFENSTASGTAHTSTAASASDNLFEITGTKGTLLIYGEEQPEIYYRDAGKDGSLRKIHWEPEPYYVPLNLFIENLTGAEHSMEGLDGQAAVEIVCIVQSAYQSMREEKKVYVEYPQ
ncbi:Gfo/Idh/MocA family protein [Alkalicoccus urumqiensis]|uniref:Gfo/Idh/MocA family oxidoreductase n=1 Tax=Alkalicoccus urumqiensis TaxID=1548213 RepID=A0A2P6MEV4_ALKUR|nr:Gfo/Idh/MocA family oxidoreductase [Alkalicoccus urumqiensis]PRO64793.1 hypothetical protein C6I21_12855 [Alkalicoccus urumqiensis]